jgi:hypothetical protein
MSENLVTWYFTISLMVFSFWFMLFFQDYSTPKTDLISWIVLLIAPLFWPIVLPISSWELTRKIFNNILI